MTTNPRFETFEISIPKEKLPLYRQKLLSWANNYEVCCLLDSQDNQGDTEFDLMLGVGLQESVYRNAMFKGKEDTECAFDQIKNFFGSGRWMMGILSYDLKRDTENLPSRKSDLLGFPDFYFFEPSIRVLVKGDLLIIDSERYSPATVYNELVDTKPLRFEPGQRPIELQSRMSKSVYLDKIDQVKRHIALGDIYELNYCQEWFAEEVELTTIEQYFRLQKVNQAPFGAYMRIKDKYMIGSSPERYLQKKGNRLLSQPIKGTIRKGTTKSESISLQMDLKASLKDRAENVMITDLVRNDLARICRPGSVQVEELFGVYEFKQVQHMISTVSGELRSENDWIDAIKATFPMGSMTGAPKVRAMQLIEELELSRRGWYSGAIGYVNPEGDFDFNVVIRSILYNSSKKYLSIHAGGAIVADSDPEKEYEECLVKTQGIRRSLSGEKATF